MNQVTDINYLLLFAGYALLIVPFFVFWYYKTGLVKDTAIAIIRMTVQLLLTGVYLEFLFKFNNKILNIAWVLLMTILATFTIVKRSELSFKLFFIPLLISTVVSISITDAFFLGVVVKLDNIFDARYFIPITGMLLGNTIKTIIIALNSYYGNILNRNNFYKWHLANGATKEEALKPFKKEALKRAFNPVIAGTAIVGLISLPGMMTGQILGGSSPNVAIKYQIMLMITIFSSSVLSVILTIILSDLFVFDEFNNLKKNILRT